MFGGVLRDMIDCFALPSGQWLGTAETEQPGV
jgi:hypothetical protein